MSTIILEHTFTTNLVKTWWQRAVFLSLFLCRDCRTTKCASTCSDCHWNHKQRGLAAICGRRHSLWSLSHICGRAVVCVLLYNNPGIYSQKKSEIPADDGAQLFTFVYFSVPLCILCWLRLLQAGIYTHFGYITRGKHMWTGEILAHFGKYSAAVFFVSKPLWGFKNTSTLLKKGL